MPKPGLPQVALLLAVAFTAGCHRGTANNQNQPNGNQPAATAAAQPSAQPPGNQATPASSAAASPPPNQPTATSPPSSATPVASGNASSPETTQPGAQQQANAPPPPPATVPSPEVPAGTVLSIRMNQGIDVKHAQSGETFSGTIVNPVNVEGDTVIPAGSIADGVVLHAHKRGHFKGASVLQLTLTGLNVNGQHYRLDTSSLTRTKKGKGKRTAAFLGGGTGLGMLIGGVASGGVGLLVGGLAGAGAGTAGAAFTGNKDINIPAESVVSFKLERSIQLR